MDEKWFFGCRMRSFQKILPSIGMSPKNTFVQHKSHIEKSMYVVVTGFVMKDNAFDHGGVAVPILCVCVGKMVKAKRDTYKRVYRDNRSYQYPKDATNKL